jgi:hypothetical protein
MATSNISAVTVGVKRCRPFVLNVMVFSPEDGFKFELAVERDCTAQNDSIWKFVFDLYRLKTDGSGTFDQIVHVSYSGKTNDENTGIQNTLDGVNEDQSDLLVNEVHPAAKQFGEDPSDANKAPLAAAMSKVAIAAL